MKNVFICFFLSLFVIQFGSSQRPFQAQLLSQFDPPTSDLPVYSGVQFNDVWGYASSGGKEIAIVGNSKYVLFLDVTDPVNPTEMYRHAPGQSVIWRDFKTFGNYAYGVCDGCNEGLWVYDLSGIDCGDPITPVSNITSQFGEAHNIYVDEDNAKLYASGVPGAVDLHIYDLSLNPANPQLLASVDFNQVSGINSSLYVHDIYVRDNIAYCSHGYTGFYIWDMNDLSNVGSNSNGGTIQLLADGDYTGYNHSSWLTEDGNYAVVAEEVPGGEPLVIVDLTQLFSNNSISFVTDFQHKLESTGASSWPTPHNPYIRNNYVFISYYEDGLKVFNISNPSFPLLHSFYDTYSDNNGFYSGTEGAWGCYPYLPSGNVLITDITYGVHIFDVVGTQNCADGVQNQDETGIDCGGKYCLPCANCLDGIQNQDETGIDCGGSICCAPCIATCSDGIQNQDETGIDCGGTICPPCDTCTDGIQNQNETGIDCGGPDCIPCDCDGIDLVINTDVNTSLIEKYDNSVISSGPVNVNAPASVSYYAGNYLLLNPEFEVRAGAELLLDIENCQ